MNISDLLRETFSALNSNRARSILTVLGVVIGISAVIAMTSLIGGIKDSIVGEMGMTQARAVNISCLYGDGVTIRDVKDMSKSLDASFSSITPVFYGSADISSSSKNAEASISGVGAEYADTANFKFSRGQFFSKKQADAGNLVVVLYETGVKTLFGASDYNAVGETVRIKGVEYEVIGIIKSDGPALNSGSVDVFMPYLACAQRIVGTTKTSQINALAKEGVDVQSAADAARSWLINRLQIPESEQEDTLAVYTMQSIIDQMDTIIAAFQALMTVVASVSLLVGGIGIMNMMLTNVTERIREIGLRKALGARRRDITRQFLIEAILITLVGGAIGILLGYAFASLLSGIASAALGMNGGMAITPSIGIDTVAEVVGVCVVIGVVFGYYPARRAAKLDPVESLRYQ